MVEVREARPGAAWALVSNRVPPSQPELTLRDLQPARWYAVRVAAHSDAGAAQHEFLFATRNAAGGTSYKMGLLFYKDTEIIYKVLCLCLFNCRVDINVKCKYF